MNSLSKNPVSLTRKLFSLLTFIVMVAAAAPVRAQLTYIYNFTGGTDGGSPNGGLVYNQSDQKLYGTTLNGGIFGDAPGDGTVFSISEGGGFLTVYSFANSSDGLGPVTGVTATTTNGNLIVTAHNGSRYPGNDSGALSLIVQASPPFNTNYWNGGLNYDFTGLADGAHPEGALILADDGNYYGTTADGGAYGMGTIYQINPTNFVPTILWSFSGADGDHPTGVLLEDTGVFYGTTLYGGSSNSGTLFSIEYEHLFGSEYLWWLTTLHSFTNGPDGMLPTGSLTHGWDGLIYGTTSEGGIATAVFTNGCGTVFQFDPATGILNNLHNFDEVDDGADPGPLRALPDLLLYGTTTYGGPFEDLPNGQPGGTFYSIDYSGNFNPLEYLNSSPQGPLVWTYDGYIIGTEAGGGEGHLYGDIWSYFVPGLANSQVNQAGQMKITKKGPRVRVFSSADIINQLQYVDSVTDMWSDLGMPMPGTGLTGLFDTTGWPPLTTARFYRVELDPTPYPPGPPTITSSAATSVTPTSAMFNGTVIADHADTSYYWQYGTDPNNLDQSTGFGVVTADNVAPMAVSFPSGSLMPGAAYYVQFVGANSAGASTGAVQTLSTPVPPQVTTGQPTSVGTTSAVLKGTINGEGSQAIGLFQYGTDTNYLLGTQLGAYFTTYDNDTESYSYTLPGLLPGITYHYRAYGYNCCAEGFGQDATFTTGSASQPAPFAQTLTPLSVTASGATFDGNVNPYGAETHTYFEYGTSPGYGTTVDPQDIPGGSGLQNLQYPISLAPGSYYYHLVAYNSNGTTDGGPISFTITAAQPPPYAQTWPASNITASSALFSASVNAEGAETHAYFEYGPNTGYGTTLALEDLGGGSTTQLLQYTQPLAPGIYYYQIVAYNSGGTSYGGGYSFTIPAAQPLPGVVTEPASVIYTNGATLNASVNPNGAETHAYFQWGTSTGYGNYGPTNDLVGSTSQSVPYALSGLNPNTHYHFRIVAYNSAGTSNGMDTNFTTLPLPPTVTTEPGDNNGGYGTLTFNANVNPNGGNTYVYFQWGTTEGSLVNTTQPSVNIGSGTTTVSVPPVNVSIGNTAVNYYFRAVASNPSGLIYGSTLEIYGGAPQ